MTDPDSQQQGDIQPLPSHWRGTAFRSRTEARWAVFFDALGVRWEYEPEGFRLSDGTWYLPDLWLPNLTSWAEVKPRCGFTPEEREKCVRLCADSGHRVLLLDGCPEWKTYEMILPAGVVGPEDAGPLGFWVGLWGKWLLGEVCWAGGKADGKYWDDARAEAAVTMSRNVDLTDPSAGDYLPMGWEGIQLPDTHGF